MSTEITTPFKQSALAVMAARINVDPVKLLDTLKLTVFKGATDSELMTLVVVANRYGLDPMTKEIYAFPAKGGGIVPVVSVDGWTNLANSHPQMDGMEFEFEHSDNGALISCTCIIHRKDRSKPVRVTEYLSECKRNTDPWKMEHRMLRHKALIQGVRIAFGFSGIVDEDDAGVRDVTPTPIQAAVVPEVKRSKKQTVEVALSEEASTVERLLALMDAKNVNWIRLAPIVQSHGLDVDPEKSLLEQHPEVLEQMLEGWPTIAGEL